MTGFEDTRPMEIKRGSIWYADINVPGMEDLPKKARPVIIVSNDRCNANAPYVTVVPLTTQLRKMLPTHVIVPNSRETGLKAVSIAKAEDIMPVRKEDLLSCVGMLPSQTVYSVEDALCVQLGIEI